jgi:small subunit ribosomal protein S11
MAAIGALRSKINSIVASAALPAAAAAAAAARMPDSVVTVNATMNNIHACVSNLDGQVVSKGSGGVLGLKHRARATPEAARDIGEQIARKAYDLGYRVSHIRLKGPSRGRSQVLRGLISGGLKVYDIKDITPMPTNGCRPKTMRRL